MNANVASIHASMHPKYAHIEKKTINSHFPFRNHVSISLVLTDYGQRICPSYTAQAQFEAIRFGAANLSEIVRVPAKREGNTSNNHADSCEQTKADQFELHIFACIY